MSNPESSTTRVPLPARWRTNPARSYTTMLRKEEVRLARTVPGLIALSDIEFVVVFNPQTPDRTAAIEGRGPSPLPWLSESAQLLQQMGASHLAYPCNTAHYFLHRASAGELPLAVPLVDMIAETARAVAQVGCRRVGLLATTGTIRTALYQDALSVIGLEVLLPERHAPAVSSGDIDENGRVRSEAYARLGVRPDGALDARRLQALVAHLTAHLGEQDGLVMETIAGAFGVKAGYTTGVAPQLAAEAARRLVERGAEAIVLGCTELPLVLTGRDVRSAGRAAPLIDPTRVVADRLRGMNGRHGIAGGLGPEATIDILEKMDAPADFIALQRDILRATIGQLGARRDQDHLKMLAIAGPDPVDAARRLTAAGAGFLVLAESAAPVAAAVGAATGLPVLATRPGRRLGSDIVRLAASPPART